MKQTDPQMKIRLPPDLKARIEAAAAANNRSMNAEIVSRLEILFFEEDQWKGAERPMMDKRQHDIIASNTDLINFIVDEIGSKVQSIFSKSLEEALNKTEKLKK